MGVCGRGRQHGARYDMSETSMHGWGDALVIGTIVTGSSAAQHLQPQQQQAGWVCGEAGMRSHRVCRRWGADTRAPALARGPKASRSKGVCNHRPRLSPTTAERRGQEARKRFRVSREEPYYDGGGEGVYSQALASKGRGWFARATSRAPLAPLHGTAAPTRLLRNIAISRRS